MLLLVGCRVLYSRQLWSSIILLVVASNVGLHCWPRVITLRQEKLLHYIAFLANEVPSTSACVLCARRLLYVLTVKCR